MGLWDRKHNCFILGSCNILRRPEHTALRNCHLKNERLFPFDYNFLKENLRLSNLFKCDVYGKSWYCFEIYMYRYPGKLLSGSRVNLLVLPGRGSFNSTLNCFLYSESLDQLSPAGYVLSPRHIHLLFFLDRYLYGGFL